MGLLQGFAVTLRQVGKGTVTEHFPKEKRPDRRPASRSPRPQSLRGRHGEVHRL